MYFRDLSGQKFGRLTVTSSAGTKGGHAYWRCVCDCGNEKIARGSHLTSGNVASCGCLGTRRTHGGSRSQLYRVWRNMLSRCYSPKDRGYEMYGGRGIFICDEWRIGFEPFQTWALGNGYQAGLTIERKDTNGPYSPENCKWATPEEQANNTRRNWKITYKGETRTLAQWSRQIGIKQTTLRNRLISGWSVEKAFTQEVRKNVSK